MNDVDVINSITKCKVYKCEYADCPLHFGQNYIRMALVAEIEQCLTAAKNIKAFYERHFI